MIPNEVMKEEENPILLRVWRANKTANTILMTIPEVFVKKYNIQAKDNLLAIDTEKGILLRKVDLGALA